MGPFCAWVLTRREKPRLKTWTVRKHRGQVDLARSIPLPGRFGLSKSNGAVIALVYHRFWVIEISPTDEE
jgi:hypothetical protein